MIKLLAVLLLVALSVVAKSAEDVPEYVDCAGYQAAYMTYVMAAVSPSVRDTDDFADLENRLNVLESSTITRMEHFGDPQMEVVLDAVRIFEGMEEALIQGEEDLVGLAGEQVMAPLTQDVHLLLYKMRTARLGMTVATCNIMDREEGVPFGIKEAA